MLFQISKFQALKALDRVVELNYPDYARAFEACLLKSLFTEISSFCYGDFITINKDAYHAYLQITEQ